MLAMSASGCVLNFDKFIDGSPASDASTDVTGDYIAPAGCPLPWLVVGVGSSSTTSEFGGVLKRFSLHADGTFAACDDIAGMPNTMRSVAVISPTRFGIPADTDTWLVDTSGGRVVQSPIQNYAGFESVDAFALVDSGPVLAVTYHDTTYPAGTIQRVRFFDAIHGTDHGVGSWDLTTPIVHLPTGAMPTGVTSHPGSNFVDPMKMLIVFGDPGQPVYEAEPLHSNNSGPFWGPAPGVGYISVRSLSNDGAAMVASNNGGIFRTNNTSNPTTAPDGPYRCPDYCDSYLYAMRDPTSDGLLIAGCVKNNYVHVVRWAIPNGSCNELTNANVNASEPIRGIAIVRQ